MENQFRKSVLKLTAVSTALVGVAVAFPSAALAQTNPNADEWTLVGVNAASQADGGAGAGVIVGLFDGYTDCRHVDLKGRCFNNAVGKTRYAFYDSHGTHTAGIIAGAKYGVAPGATIQNYGVFNNGRYVATGGLLIQAWVNAEARGATVASMSFGCKGLALCFSADEVKAMGGYATSYGATNKLLFVKAAGNDSLVLSNESIAVTQAQASAAIAKLLLVGSVDANGGLSYFSNTPGDNCLVYTGASGCAPEFQWKYHFLVAPGEQIYSTLPGNTYGYMSGTSMATPVVSGAAALLETKWPTLKTKPALVANILLTTTTDLGAPGVDGTFGYGLLNVPNALANGGRTSIVSPQGSYLDLNGMVFSPTGTTLASLTRVLSDVSAYDAYGRDYRLNELKDFRLAGRPAAVWSGDALRLMNVGSQSEWSAAFFDRPAAPMVSFGFGPPSARAISFAAADRSLRAGLDAPLDGQAMLSVRLSGEAGMRGDLAADNTLRPLSFFASSDLLNQSALVGYSRPLGEGRLMVFGASALGGSISYRDQATPVGVNRGLDAASNFVGGRSPLRQVGVGVSYWMRPDARTVVGVMGSAYAQRSGYYDLVSDLANFAGGTKVYNLGGAASRTLSPRWELFGSAEVSKVDVAAYAGPIRFTDATIVSAEAGLKATGVLFNDARRRDDLSLALALAPTAVKGALRLDYFQRTPDGLDREAVSRTLPLADLAGSTARVEVGYQVRGTDRASLGVGGVASLGGDRNQEVVGYWKRRF